MAKAAKTKKRAIGGKGKTAKKVTPRAARAATSEVPHVSIIDGRMKPVIRNAFLNRPL